MMKRMMNATVLEAVAVVVGYVEAHGGDWPHDVEIPGRVEEAIGTIASARVVLRADGRLRPMTAGEAVEAEYTPLVAVEVLPS